ncbi:preprotein translocase subunit SecG [Aliiroseovarius sp. 2305UL8-7]|uniref:preprotein translocase subunit SecG n=1 Tax=Aliiroseovarius conchicola TaxID=3121637 RepID=UPI0035281DF6
MENVILVIHLILALSLIGIVLLQRSEGGGLGIGGGGGGGGGVMSSRGAATALGKLTWIFAIAFLTTSITLTIIAAKNSSDASVVDALGLETPAADGAATPTVPDVTDLLPPTNEGDSLTPPRAD